MSNLDVHSVDYEETVVAKMEESKPKDLNLRYTRGDVTDLKDFKEGEFQYAVDKGTLDAIAINDKEETVKMCHTYFKEMVRVLDKDGVFIFITLLQPHVLKIVIDYFVKGGNETNLFSIKFQQIENIKGYAEKQFIKYFVSIKKNFIDTTNPKMVEMRDKMQDLVFIKDTKEQKEQSFTSDKATDKIKTDQQMFMINPEFKSLHKARQI